MPPFHELPEDELIKLIHEWQNNPAEYTRRLVDFIYPTLKRMCGEEVAKEYNTAQALPAGGSSLLNDVYIKLNNGYKPENEINSARSFQNTLARIIQQVLLDRHKSLAAIKRNDFTKDGIAPPLGLNMTLYDEYLDSGINPDIFQKSLDTLRDSFPEVAEALSLRYYTLNDIDSIAKLMQKSTSTINAYIKRGKQLLSAIIIGVDDLGALAN